MIAHDHEGAGTEGRIDPARGIGQQQDRRTQPTHEQRRLHHEPFEPDAESWTIPERGPLSGANGALPWMLFERDRERFEAECPAWEIASIRLDLPVSYLLSGGVSMRSLMPGWSFGFWRGLEDRFERWMRTLGTFATIVLVRGR